MNAALGSVAVVFPSAPSTGGSGDALAVMGCRPCPPTDDDASGPPPREPSRLSTLPGTSATGSTKPADRAGPCRSGRTGPHTRVRQESTGSAGRPSPIRAGARRPAVANDTAAVHRRPPARSTEPYHIRGDLDRASTIARDAIDLLGPRAAYPRVRASGLQPPLPGRLTRRARRWCGMAACGSRSKSAAYRRRRSTTSRDHASLHRKGLASCMDGLAASLHAAQRPTGPRHRHATVGGAWSKSEYRVYLTSVVSR